MILKNKVAIIYGASGDVGSATAKAFAREGARVFLSARRREPLEALAKEITAAGGNAEAAPVDALDGAAVEKHAGAITAKAGGIDISFNAIDRGAPQGTPVIDMKVEDFSLPLEAAARTHFFTGTSAARQMMKKRSGVILAITANVAKTAVPNTGAFGVACAMIEANLPPARRRVRAARNPRRVPALRRLPRHTRRRRGAEAALEDRGHYSRRIGEILDKGDTLAAAIAYRRSR